MATSQKPTVYQRWRRRLVQSFFVLAGFYATFLLLGYLPINCGFTAPAASDSVRLFIRSNEIHSDFVLPTYDEETAIDWRELFPPEHFPSDVRGARYVAVGWGTARSISIRHGGPMRSSRRHSARSFPAKRCCTLSI
jgi:hypothetical protein